MNCIGLFGWLFGHKYVPIYDNDREEYSVDEKIKLAEMSEATWSLSTSDKLNEGMNKPKRITNVYIGHYCVRCGDTKTCKL